MPPGCFENLQRDRCATRIAGRRPRRARSYIVGRRGCRLGSLAIRKPFPVPGGALSASGAIAVVHNAGQRAVPRLLSSHRGPAPRLGKPQPTPSRCSAAVMQPSGECARVAGEDRPAGPALGLTRDAVAGSWTPGAAASILTPQPPSCPDPGRFRLHFVSKNHRLPNSYDFAILPARTAIRAARVGTVFPWVGTKRPSGRYPVPAQLAVASTRFSPCHCRPGPRREDGRG
jgi:hypothetical protein